MWYLGFCLLLHYLTNVGECIHVTRIRDSIGADDSVHLCQLLAEKLIKEASVFVPSCALRWTSGKHAKTAMKLISVCEVVSVAA